MERMVEVNGKNLVLGLEWSKLAGDKPADAAKRTAQARKCNMGVLWSVSVDDDEGLSSKIVHSLGLCHNRFKGAIYSGAAALAMAQSSVIGIEQLDDDLFWMIVTENGRVLPGYDSLGSEAEIKRKLQELALDIQLDYMQSYMTAQVAQRFSIDESIDESPLNLIGKSTISEAMRIKKLSSIPRAVYLGAGILALGGGLFAYTQHLEAEKQRELEALIAAESQNLDNIEQEVTVEKVIDKGPTDADLLKMARQEEITWLRDDFNKVNRLPAMKSILLNFISLPNSANGWDLKEVVYTSDRPDAISAIWKRTFGSPNSIKEVMKGRANTGFTPDFSQASSSIKVNIGNPGIEDVLKIINENGIGHQDFISRLVEKSLPFDASVSESKERRHPIAGLKDKALENIPQLEISSRLISISSDKIEDFAVAMEVLEPADNYLIDRITFFNQGAGKVNWKIEGKLYE